MTEYKKKAGFTDKIKKGLDYVFKIITSGLFTTLAEGTEMMIKIIERRLRQIEKKIYRRLTYFLLNLSGLSFLILALLFYLTDYLMWSKSIALMTMGIAIIFIGFVIRITHILNENN